MARQEDEREDLLNEATALVSRAELSVGGFSESIVAGFRRDGSASVFFGQNIAYQFNCARELRRVFLNENLYKAQSGRLIQLTRHRTEAAVELVRHELNLEELARLLAEARQRLNQLTDAISAAEFKVIGEVPTNGDFIKQFGTWLEKLPEDIKIANAPGLR